MIITATELKYNLGKYLKLVDNEDITIKKNDNHLMPFLKFFQYNHHGNLCSLFLVGVGGTGGVSPYVSQL